MISGELAGVFERLGSNAENRQARLQKLSAGRLLRGRTNNRPHEGPARLQKLSAGRLLGRFFAASRARLREVAERLGVHHLANLGGCAAR